MKKVLFVNLIVIICLLLFLELFFMFIAANYRLNSVKDESLLKCFKQDNVVKYILNSYFKHPHSVYLHGCENLRPIAGEEYTSAPIVLFGCSITYGNLLNDDNNFSGVLSKVAKRPVYNMAYDGWSPAYMLKQLEENRNLLFIKEPEYIIYTFIKDHKKRLVFYQGWGFETQLYLRYSFDKNGELYSLPCRYPFYWRLFTTKYIQHAIEKIKSKKTEQIDELLFCIFERSTSIVKNRWPNAKLVMLVYNDEMCQNEKNKELYRTEDTLTKVEQEKFKEMGFEIYNMEELVSRSLCGEEYHARCPMYGDVDHHHPSSKMWEEFVPKLVEKLKM